jgi:hypothetical protein
MVYVAAVRCLRSKMSRLNLCCRIPRRHWRPPDLLCFLLAFKMEIKLAPYWGLAVTLRGLSTLTLADSRHLVAIEPEELLLRSAAWSVRLPTIMHT